MSLGRTATTSRARFSSILSSYTIPNVLGNFFFFFFFFF